MKGGEKEGMRVRKEGGESEGKKGQKWRGGEGRGLAGTGRLPAGYWPVTGSLLDPRMIADAEGRSVWSPCSWVGRANFSTAVANG